MRPISKTTLKVNEAAFSNDKFEIFILSKNIFKIKPKENIELDAQDAFEIRKNFASLAVGNKWAVLTDGGNYFTTTSEFRQLLASKAFTDHRVALAIVTKSMATKIIGNFFIKVNKPGTPTKLFISETDAYDWLNNQMLSLQ